MDKDSKRTSKRTIEPRRLVDAAPDGRVLVFHTGIHKTGSTALQTYLAHNADRLKKAGVAYVYATAKRQGPGNGQHLFELMHNRKVTPSQIDDLLTVHLDNCPTAIISSEDFTHFGLTEWQQIAEASQRLRGQVRTVTFVRDLAPYCSSLHAQLRGSGESHDTFKAFSAQSDIFVRIFDSLKCLLQTFKPESMTVLHYESVIAGIDKAFLGALGLPCDPYDTAPLLERANRSLTELEQDIVLRVTKSAGLQLARGLSGHLKVRRPDLKFTMHFDARLVAQLSTRYASELEWLNQTFFGSESVVQVARNLPDGQPKVELTEAVSRDIYCDVIDWCLGRLTDSQKESFLQMGRLLREIDWNLAADPLVPPDFDPMAYLAHNPDIVRNGTPPFRHFITIGHKEHRIWKWTN
jgi:hypothetical protein